MAHDSVDSAEETNGMGIRVFEDREFRRYCAACCDKLSASELDCLGGELRDVTDMIRE